LSRKGIKIKQVIIQNGNVTAIDNDGESINLTRTERNILRGFRSNTYVQDIIKCFGNKNILDDDYSVIKDGETKFTKTK